MFLNPIHRLSRRLRRWASLVSALALLLPASAALGAQTPSIHLNFTAADQPILGTGPEPSFGYDRYFAQTWDQSGHAGGYDNPCVDYYLGSYCLGNFGAEASGSTSGKIGLGIHTRATGGSVSLTYPLRIRFHYPDDGTLQPGDTFQIRASYETGTGQSLTTRSLDLNAWVDVPFAFKARAEAAAEAFGERLFGGTVADFDFSMDPTVLNTAWLDEPEAGFAQIMLRLLLEKVSENVLSFSLEKYNLNLTGGSFNSGLTLQNEGQDDFLALTANLTNLLIYLLIRTDESGLTEAEKTAKKGTKQKIGNFLLEQILFNKNINSGGFTLAKQIADLVADFRLGMRQKVTFTPTPTVTLRLSTGQVVTLRGTEPATVTMPLPPPGAATNNLTITPISVSLDDNELVHEASVVITPGLTFTPLNLAFGGSVGGHSLGSHSFQPVDPFGVSAPITERVSRKSFKLGGLSTAGPQQPFTVVGYTYPVPTISLTGGLSPAAVGPGSVGSTLTVRGTGFVPPRNGYPGTRIVINNVVHDTTFVNEGEVWTTLTAEDVAGDAQVTVFNPAPAGGTSNAVRLIAPGPVASWGANARGQLGNGSTADSLLPVPVGGLPAPGQMLAGGARHSLALLTDFTVWAWGDNSRNQLGKSVGPFSAVPVHPEGTFEGSTSTSFLAGVTTAIAAGGDHSVATVRDPGTKRLGIDYPLRGPFPADLTNCNIGLYPDGYEFYPLGYDGPYVWDGTYVERYLHPESGVVDYAFVPNVFTSVSVPDSLPATWGWGANDRGQLGDLSLSASAFALGVKAGGTRSVTVVDGLETGTLPPLDEIEAKWAEYPPLFEGCDYGIHSVQGSRVVAAGLGGGPWLGHCSPCIPPEYLTNPPTNPANPEFLRWLAASVTGMQTHREEFPRYLNGQSQVAAGADFTLFLDGSGILRGVGSNANGQLGRGTTSSAVLTPEPAFPTLLGVRAAAAGGRHTLAIKASNGTLWAAGANDHGQLGNNSTTGSPSPVQVQGLTGNLLAVAGGESFSLALVEDAGRPGTGTVWAWGENTYGQLGNGTQGDAHVPVRVLNLDRVVTIAAGDHHALALRDDGTVWAWGRNDHGQLGDNTTTDRSQPIQVKGTLGIQAIAAGGSHSLALGRVDTSTPITTATVTPEPGPADPQGRRWNNTLPTVTLQATAPGGLGVARIIYSAAGAQTIASTSVDGDRVEVPITAEGTTALTFRSVGLNDREESQAQTLTVHVDRTAPTVSFGTPSAAASLTNGWYPGAVSIDYTASDVGSGVNAGLTQVMGSGATVNGSTLSFETAQAGQSANVMVTDYAGNTATFTSPEIHIDTQPPATEATLVPPPNAAGWSSGDVMVRLRAFDDLSGVGAVTYGAAGAESLPTATTSGAEADSAAVAVGAEGLTTVTYHALDRAGNAESTRTLTVRVDKTAPTLTTQVTPLPTAFGWSPGAVRVTATAQEGAGGSGLAGIEGYIAHPDGTVQPLTAPVIDGSVSVDVTAEGPTTVTFVATDLAGNRSVETVPVRVDSAAPELTAAAETEDGAVYEPGSWTQQNVRVTFQAGAASGIVGITATKTTPAGTGPADLQTDPSGDFGDSRASTTFASEGDAQSVVGTAVSRAGTSSSPVAFGPIRIDRTAPATEVSPSELADPAGWHRGPLQVSLNASDALSGVAETHYALDGEPARAYSGPFEVTGDGEHTLRFWSVDRAGNAEEERALTLRITSIAPTVLPGPKTATSQYSDAIPDLPLSATDTATPLSASTTWSSGGGASAPGLPEGLSLTAGAPGSWNLGGRALQGVGSYEVMVEVTNAAGLSTTTSYSLSTTAEDALVSPLATNPQAVAVRKTGGAAGPITLGVSIAELPDGSPGSIATALPVTLTLTPLGPGSPREVRIPALGSGVLPDGSPYQAAVQNGVLTVSCALSGIGVNLYTLEFRAGGNYLGAALSTLAVYDPSLDPAAGDGDISRDGTLGHVDFSAVYHKSGRLLGSLQYTESRPEGSLVLQSSALSTLSIVQNTAILTGEASLNGRGGYTFTATLIDKGEPGASDQFGLRVKDPTGAVVPGLDFAPIALTAGNLQVPKPKSSGK